MPTCAITLCPSQVTDSGILSVRRQRRLKKLPKSLIKLTATTVADFEAGLTLEGQGSEAEAGVHTEAH
ncbi:hypothetical protein DPMN_087183 [Dreissena polymorpha]|uniref:Uncharacterized protein n=1 Tax=Dreissena polymorpha TaxID=45954 RepID=A0A9D4KTE1_DREPO|nr:hypothetical protein DPMN_087183 [Dreissena polymorpha]